MNFNNLPVLGIPLSVSESSLQKASKYELLDPDVRLMLQVREGSAAAFEALVEKHQKRLVMVLEHLVSDRTQAEDLAQDVFLRVYRARERYIPTAKFSTWLYTITHNVASNSIRKSSRRKEINLVASPSGSMPVRPLDTMAKDKSNLMPTRLADQKEMEKVIREAIQSLGPRQRMAMLLSKYEGMSYNEIAESMELTTQAVKSLLSRARGNLKEALAPYLNSGKSSRELEREEGGAS
ncbi:MAG: sigma-70 family RNA polymerase sigma factor [Mariniblastus sp.]|nr:sigma-70 family RNA polymerase sigma factor [Mariniblastus sp.]MDG2182880.1 sigma-70 family RNA polymerase sigma factor [Mariniblastus sp.]